MKTKQTLILVLATIVLFSCKSGKRVVASATADDSATLKSISASHNAASPNFKTLAGRVHVAYKDDKKSQSITASIRMEKDKKIWIKASILGITLAKVLITPDRVSYYETLNNTYFDGDFTLLSDFLGTEIDFSKAQAILLGQSIFTINPSRYKTTVEANKYKIEPKLQPENFIHTIFLNPNNFKVASEMVKQDADNRLLTVMYDEYQTIDGGYYPSEILINASEKAKNTSIKLKYKKIDLNVSVSFPFTIPNNYTQIEL